MKKLRNPIIQSLFYGSRLKSKQYEWTHLCHVNKKENASHASGSWLLLIVSKLKAKLKCTHSFVQGHIIVEVHFHINMPTLVQYKVHDLTLTHELNTIPLHIYFGYHCVLFKMKKVIITKRSYFLIHTSPLISSHNKEFPPHDQTSVISITRIFIPSISLNTYHINNWVWHTT